MGKFDKAKERLLSIPSDYTYSEARYLLGKLGFQEYQKGKTSGSRVLFYRAHDNKKVLLHKPHPGDEMSVGSTRALCEQLKEWGEI